MPKQPLTPAAARRTALILYLIAVVFACFSGAMALRTLHFLRTAQTAPGTVIALERGTTSKSRGFAPVFQFTDNGGATHTIKSKISSSPPAYAVGEAIEVLYDPNDVKGAEPRGWMNWFFPLMTALPAVILTSIGTVFLLLSFLRPSLK